MPLDRRDEAAARREKTSFEKWTSSRNGRLLGNSDWQIEGKSKYGLSDAQINKYISSQKSAQVAANKNVSTSDLQLKALGSDNSGPMQAARLAALFTPGVGAGLAASGIAEGVGEGDAGKVALNALGLVAPVIPRVVRAGVNAARLPGDTSRLIAKQKAVKGVLGQKQIAVNMPTEGIQSFIKDGKYKTVLDNVLEEGNSNYLASRQSLNDAAFGGQNVAYGFLTKTNPRTVPDFRNLKQDALDKWFNKNYVKDEQTGMTVVSPELRANPNQAERAFATRDRLQSQPSQTGSGQIANVVNPKGSELSWYFGKRNDTSGKRERALGGTVFLNKDVANRSTFTPGDSLGLSLREADAASATNGIKTVEFFDSIPVGKVSPKTLTEVTRALGSKGDYLEAQIFGGINLADVKKILMESPEQAADISALLKSKGINIPVGTLQEVYRNPNKFETIMYNAALKVKTALQRLPSFDDVAKSKADKKFKSDMAEFNKKLKRDWLSSNPGSTSKDYEAFLEAEKARRLADSNRL
jgi:hypothetical protein